MQPVLLHAEKPRNLGYPQELQALGDHIRARRLDLGLLQREVAKQIGVNPVTILNWEKNHRNPPTRSYPAIMKFLGYCPVQYPKTVGERIRQHRIQRGFTILELANILGVDPSTVGNWERGIKSPYRQSEKFLKRIFQLPL